MIDTYPELSKKVTEMEAHTIQFDSVRTKLTNDLYDAKMKALQEIGSHFGHQALKAIHKNENTYSVILDAYSQSQNFRVHHLDGVSVSLGRVIGADNAPLIQNFSKELNVSVLELNDIMHSKVFTKITFDMDSQTDNVLDALSMLGIDHKQLIICDDNEQGASSLHVQFDQFHTAVFLEFCQNNNINCKELIDENPFGKITTCRDAQIEDLSQEELKGLKAALRWDLLDNQLGKSCDELNNKINKVNELLTDNDSGLRC